MNTNKIIGLSGTFASGKDTLAHYLVKEKNYLHVSTGDMVRQEALMLRGSVERPVLQEVADELRRKHGAGVLVDLAVKTYQERLKERDDCDGLVVSGLRSLGEAKVVKSAGGVLVFVDAPEELRYQRMVSRKRDAETQLTLAEFKKQEALELEGHAGDDAAFNILAIKDMADKIIINDSDLNTFIERCQQEIGF
ncbi:MAG: nucleoside monophosphate kinase [Candidatus Woesebacteria bacterium]|jgi:dephospho-CoA kinase